MVERRVTAIAGDVGTDGLGLDDDGRAALAGCDIVIHSAATVAFDSPLDSAVEVNLLGPSRIAATLHDLGVTPHLVAVSTCYVAGNRRGAAPEEPRRRQPLLRRRRLAGRGGGRPPGPHRRRGRQPHPRGRSPGSARRPAPSWAPPARPLLADKTEQLRQAGSSDRMVEAGRARAASLGWPDAYAYTKALGERALLAEAGRRAGHDRAPVDHRVGAGRAPPGLDPGLPHGRAGDHQLRPGPAQGVPRRARGHRRRHPRRPRGGRHHRRRRRRPRPTATPDVVQVASGSANPLRYRKPRRPGAGLVHRAPALRQRRPADRGARVVVPRPGPGAAPARAGRSRRSTGPRRRSRRCRCGASRPSGRPRLESKREEAERAAGLRRALRRLRRVRGDLRRRPPAGPLGPARRRRPAAVLLRPAGHRLDDLRPRRSTCRRWSQHARVRTTPGGRTGEDRAEPPAPPGARPRPPLRRLRPREHADRLERGGVVLVARHPPPAPRGPGALRPARRSPRRPSLLAQDRRDRSDFLRHFYRRYDGAPVAQLEEDGAEMFSDLLLAKSFPAAIRRVREHRRPGTAPCSSPGRSTSSSTRCGRCSTTSCAPSWPRRPDGTYSGELTDVPPTGEARAQAMADYAAANGFDLAESVAYADSTSDLPMLDAVGFPGGGQPRDPAGRPGPQAGLAGRELRPSPPARRAASCPWARSGGRAARASSTC